MAIAKIMQTWKVKYSNCLPCSYSLLLCVMVGVKPSTLCMLGKPSAIDAKSCSFSH